MALEGEVAIVTDATSGIGLGIARELARAGADVLLDGFGDAGEIERLRGNLSDTFRGRTACSGADMPKPDQIAGMIDQKQPSHEFVTPEELGGLSVFLCSEAAAPVRGRAPATDGGWTAQ